MDRDKVIRNVLAKLGRKKKQAPKKWWNKMVRDIKENNPEYSEEQVDATVGDIWYNKVSPKVKTKILKKFSEDLKKLSKLPSIDFMQGPPVISEARLKTQFYNVTDKYKGFFTDTGWGTIRKLQAELEKVLPNLIQMGSGLYNPGLPMKTKTWNMLGGFETPQGKKRVVFVNIVASGAGSIKDPLDKYDITATINIVSPRTVKLKTEDEEYLKEIGILQK